MQNSIKQDKSKLPLFLSVIHAGFPSSADDYIEKVLDLNELVISTPEATFYVRVSGDSMKNAGIWDGDILVVDRALNPTHKAIIVAILNNEFTVKRLYIRGQDIYLLPANPIYKPIKISEEMEFQVWGVVRAVVHIFDHRRK